MAFGVLCLSFPLHGLGSVGPQRRPPSRRCEMAQPKRLVGGGSVGASNPTGRGLAGWPGVTKPYYGLMNKKVKCSVENGPPLFPLVPSAKIGR